MVSDRRSSTSGTRNQKNKRHYCSEMEIFKGLTKYFHKIKHIDHVGG